MHKYICNFIATDGTLQLSVPINVPNKIREWLYNVKHNMKVDLYLNISRKNNQNISHKEILDFFDTWVSEYKKGNDDQCLQIQICNAETSQIRLFASAECTSFDRKEKIVSLSLENCKLDVNDNVVYLDGYEYLSVPTLLEEAADYKAVIIIMKDKDGKYGYNVSEDWTKESLWFAISKVVSQIHDSLFGAEDEDNEEC